MPQINFVHFKFTAPRKGVAVLVGLRGVESDVVLMDGTNFERFKRGSSYEYRGGGHYKRSPARVVAPGPGEWHVAVIPGPGGKVEATFTLQ